MEAIKRTREALNFLCEYVLDQKYDLKFALEAKPNEPRGDIYNPTTGHMLAFIATLDHPEMVGVNPEVAHEHMAGLNFMHGVAQAWEAGKLFHIDLNDQYPGRYDQDLRFGSRDLKAAFFLVKFLEDVGYQGSRHFDAHAYRTEDYEGVKDFARGCMRTYLILKEKAARSTPTRRSRRCWRRSTPTMARMAPFFGRLHARESRRPARRSPSTAPPSRSRGLQYERLDQLTDRPAAGSALIACMLLPGHRCFHHRHQSAADRCSRAGGCRGCHRRIRFRDPAPAVERAGPASCGGMAAQTVHPRRAAEIRRRSGEHIAAIGLTGQMHGLVLLDEAGQVLRPAILWNDQRTGAQCDEIHRRVGRERFIQITGNVALTGFTAPKILWVAQNEPEIYAQRPACPAAQGLRALPADRRVCHGQGRWRRDGAVRPADSATGRPRCWRRWTFPQPGCRRPSKARSSPGSVTAEAAAATGLKAGTPVVGGRRRPGRRRRWAWARSSRGSSR